MDGRAEFFVSFGRGNGKDAVNRLCRALVIALGLPLSACAGAGANDPLEPFNRTMFDFNQSLDRRAALPAATFYKSAVPEPVRIGVHNFLSNLHMPVTFANDVLQGEFSRARDAAGRFGVNTTLGIGGVTDPATGMGMTDQSEDFGQTLGVYGVPGGPYMVLPLLGSALPRDLFGKLVVDRYFNPLGYVTYRGKYFVSLSQNLFSIVDQRSRKIDQLRDIERESVDRYATQRDGYLQHREDEIHNRSPENGDPAAH